MSSKKLPDSANEEIFKLCLKHVKEVKHRPWEDKVQGSDKLAVWAAELTIAVWYRDWSPGYRATVLEEFETHVSQHFDKHNKTAPDEPWIPPPLHFNFTQWSDPLPSYLLRMSADDI